MVRMADSRGLNFEEYFIVDGLSHLYRLERKLSPAVGDGCSGLHGPIVNGQGNSNNQQSFYEYPSKIRRWRILRQGKIERRPFARPTLGPHLSTVTLHDMFNNRKSKT